MNEQHKELINKLIQNGWDGHPDDSEVRRQVKLSRNKLRSQYDHISITVEFFNNDKWRGECVKVTVYSNGNTSQSYDESHYGGDEAAFWHLTTYEQITALYNGLKGVSENG